jgi:hypothetical protein
LAGGGFPDVGEAFEFGELVLSEGLLCEIGEGFG